MCDECAAVRRELELWQSYHDREHALHGEAHEREHALNQKALDKAEATLGIRLEGMNMIRDQLRDQAGTFVTRDGADARHAAIDVTIDIISKRLDAMDNWRSGIEGRTIGIAAAVGLIVIIINIVIRFVPVE